jgi:flagellar basal body P-ring protein FlgI
MKSHRALLVCVLTTLAGCSTWSWEGLMRRFQSPENTEDAKNTKVIGDFTTPWNMFPAVVENVGLATKLKGTGSDPKPSPQRDLLVGEMQLRGVSSPNAVLVSKDVSMVLVKAILRAGIQEGDRFDVEVRVPSGSETTSLRGGYLLETDLKELKAMEGDHSIHQGWTCGIAEGAVLVDPAATGKKDSMALRGRVLGGGRATKSRPLGLIVKREVRSVARSSAIQEAVNRRFFMFDKHNIKVGVATARDDKLVELKVHPRYKDNPQRFMAVVRALSLKETESERLDRIQRLERQLLDPVTSARAALQLEAIGKPAIDTLAKGIQSQDLEVRFYAAEALAYLDDSRAAAPLGQIAKDSPAFRIFALTALSTLNDFNSEEQLRELMQVPSAETRYGAFRALWAMNPNNAAIRGESLGNQFSYHIIDSASPPMVHVTRSKRPEVILFGRDQFLKTPVLLEAGPRILITSPKPDQIVLSKFSLNEQDQKRFVSARLDEVIRAIVDLGGSYPDVVQALQQAKQSGSLSSRLEVDALPEAGRPYERGVAVEENADAAKKGAEKAPPVPSSPVPDLFTKPKGSQASNPEDGEGKNASAPKREGEKTGTATPSRPFFARITGS